MIQCYICYWLWLPLSAKEHAPAKHEPVQVCLERFNADGYRQRFGPISALLTVS